MERRLSHLIQGTTALVDIAGVIDNSGVDVVDLLTRQLLEVEQRLASQQRLRRVLRAVLATLPDADAAGPEPAVLIEKIQEMTDIMTRLTPEQRHELEEGRRRMVAELPGAEFIELCGRRRRAMAQLSPKDYTALRERRAAMMPDDE